MEQGSILPARAGQVAGPTWSQQLITNHDQLCYIGIIGCFHSRLVVNSASSPLCSD